MNWLTEETHGRRIYLWIFGTLLLGYIYTFAAFAVLGRMGVTIHPQVSDLKIDITSWSLPFLLFFFALIEEMMFRLPLMIAVNADADKKIIFLFAFILSVVFGLLHGGIEHIFLQGAGGFLYCILFLKCGGYQKNYLQATAVSTAAHFLWNLSLCVIGIYHGVTAI